MKYIHEVDEVILATVTHFIVIFRVRRSYLELCRSGASDTKDTPMSHCQELRLR